MIAVGGGRVAAAAADAVVVAASVGVTVAGGGIWATLVGGGASSGGGNGDGGRPGDCASMGPGVISSITFQSTQGWVAGTSGICVNPEGGASCSGASAVLSNCWTIFATASAVSSSSSSLSYSSESESKSTVGIDAWRCCLAAKYSVTCMPAKNSRLFRELTWPPGHDACFVLKAAISFVPAEAGKRSRSAKQTRNFADISWPGFFLTCNEICLPRNGCVGRHAQIANKYRL